MKRLFLVVAALLLSAIGAKAQSSVVEISWMDHKRTVYQGVIVMNNNQGRLYSKYYHPSAGTVYVSQQAVLSNNYDMYGNCISYIYCSHPNTTPYVPYSADNFIFYPNGTVYTQDYSGKWSTVVQYRTVPPYSWESVIRSYQP